MIDIARFSPIKQNYLDNCIPATIEAIMRYHKPLEDLPNQREIRTMFVHASLDPSFNNAVTLFDRCISQFSFTSEVPSSKPNVNWDKEKFDDWRDRINHFLTNESLPIAIASRLRSSGAPHIRAVLEYDSNNSQFTIYDPAMGSIDLYPESQIEEDFNRAIMNRKTGEALYTPCRDILIIEPL